MLPLHGVLIESGGWGIERGACRTIRLLSLDPYGQHGRETSAGLADKCNRNRAVCSPCMPGSLPAGVPLACLPALRPDNGAGTGPAAQTALQHSLKSEWPQAGLEGFEGFRGSNIA